MPKKKTRQMAPQKIFLKKEPVRSILFILCTMRSEENNREIEQDRNKSAPSKRILTHSEGSKLYQEYEEKKFF